MHVGGCWASQAQEASWAVHIGPLLQCHRERLPLEPSQGVHHWPHSIHVPLASGGEGSHKATTHQCSVCVPCGEGMVPGPALSKQRHRETQQREGWLSRVVLAVRHRHRFPGNAGHCHSGSDSGAPKCHGMTVELMLRWRSCLGCASVEPAVSDPTYPRDLRAL